MPHLELVCLTYLLLLFNNMILILIIISKLYDNIFKGGNNTEVDMLDLATITRMDDENPVDNETYLGKTKYSLKPSKLNIAFPNYYIFIHYENI